jgi:hypothetical protein
MSRVGKGASLGLDGGQNRARQSQSKTGVNALMVPTASARQAILPTLQIADEVIE